MSVELSFDEVVARIEDIGEELRNGSNLPLERRVELYEEGVRLTRAAKQKLKDAQSRAARATEKPLG